MIWIVWLVANDQVSSGVKRKGVGISGRADEQLFIITSKFLSLSQVNNSSASFTKNESIYGTRLGRDQVVNLHARCIFTAVELEAEALEIISKQFKIIWGHESS